MEIPNLLRVEYHGEIVLTSKQMAKFYCCAVQQIRQNFNGNKDKFIEGVHYFRLEGEELKQFKEYLAKIMVQAKDVDKIDAGNLPCTHMASSLFLWTKEGVIRHCKLIGTQEAWDVFRLLEKSYFNSSHPAPQIETPEVNPPKIEKPKNNEASVYAFAMDDGTVKIGMSGNIAERIKRIERETLLNVTGVFALKVESRQKAFEIEKTLHEYFSAQCTQGEFFSVDFNAACTQIEKLLGVTKHAPKDFAVINRLLKIAELTKDEKLREDCLKTAYELLK